ncbi:flagellar biosynthetic protein FliO [Aidingimonas lacisalsi]|uniref:flagellar biosynthetic protein FliO n=1 Tax=Aidingimonas lacisalsi TaxID=2604086 RepID=UPI001F032556|nr:flagellar biosynthetic protein FliO [Aidingimonas lacisalsi]
MSEPSADMQGNGPRVDTSGLDALSSQGWDAAASNGDSLLSMTALGKTAAVLALVIGLILLCSYLLKRFGAHRHMGGRHLEVVGSVGVGQRERVVIVAVDNTWLVLGVANGQVNKLHDLPAPVDEEADLDTSQTANDGFAARFARAMKDNTRQRFASRNTRGQR